MWDAINKAFRKAGLFPLWDGTASAAFSVGIFSWIYDGIEQKARDDVFPLFHSTDFDVLCRNCYANLNVDAGFGFDFQVGPPHLPISSISLPPLASALARSLDLDRVVLTRAHGCVRLQSDLSRLLLLSGC